MSEWPCNRPLVLLLSECKLTRANILMYGLLGRRQNIQMKQLLSRREPPTTLNLLREDTEELKKKALPGHFFH